jgi:hypothetical protein
MNVPRTILKLIVNFMDIQKNNRTNSYPGHAPGGGGKMERIVKECPWIICERQREVICA